MYGLLLDLFIGLPGDALIPGISDGRFDALLRAHAEPEGQKVREGVRLVASFRPSIANTTPDILVKELLVDRTGLIGATGQRSFRPPYERLYAANPGRDGFLLQTLNRFYRKAGLSLDDESCESPDFLFVELDFMKQLCLREMDEWSKGMPAGATRAIEREFLREHLGRWAGDYCAEAVRHARTVFYRGWLSVLDGFIDDEKVHLEEQIC